MATDQLIAQLTNKDENLKLGNKVLRLLSDKVGKSFPVNGVIAGQSVTSALLELSGSVDKVVYNDVDLFCEPTERRYRNKKFMPNGTNLFEIEQINEYGAVCSKANIFMTDVKREGDLNTINYLERTTKPSGFQYKAQNLISTFDINSVCVGVDLATGIIAYTEDFIHYLKTSQLKFCSITSPMQSILRILEKQAQRTGYLNNDVIVGQGYLELIKFYRKSHFWNRIFAAKNELNQEYLYTDGLLRPNHINNLAPYIEYLHGTVHNQLASEPSVTKKLLNSSGLPVVGLKYQNLFEKHSELLSPYFELIQLKRAYAKKGLFLVVPKLNGGSVPAIIENNKEKLQLVFDKAKFFKKTELTKVIDATLPTAQRQRIANRAKLSEGIIRFACKNNIDETQALEYLQKSNEENIRKLDQMAFQHSAEFGVILNEINNLPQYYSRLKQFRQNAIDVLGAQFQYIFAMFANHIGRKSNLIVKSETMSLFRLKTNFFKLVELYEVEQLPFKDRLQQFQYNTYNGHIVGFNSELNAFELKVNGSSQFMIEEETLLSFVNRFQNQNLWHTREFIELLSRIDSFNEMHIESRDKLVQLAQPIDKLELKAGQALEKLKSKQDLAKYSDVKVSELLTKKALAIEGSLMKHCVSGYGQYIQSGESRIISIELNSEDETYCSDVDNRATVELGVMKDIENKVSFKVVQCRGFKNKPPHRLISRYLGYLVNELNQ